MLYDANTERLVEENRALIASLAIRYAGADRDLRHDLIGEGIVLLLQINGVYNDGSASSYPFSLYLRYKVRDRMRAYLTERGRYIPVGLMSGEYEERDGY